MNEVLNIILTLFAVASLSYEVVYSTPAFYIKKMLGLDRSRPLTGILLQLSTYRKVLGDRLTTVLLPLILIAISTTGGYLFFYNLLKCPYCVSFWIGLIFSISILTLPLTTAIVYGLSSIFITSIYMRIRN